MTSPTRPTSAPEARKTKRILGWSRTSESALYVATLVITGVTTFFALDLWRANFTIPFQYTGDAIQYLAHFKTVYETGWYDFQPLLGAPYGQTYFDWTIADNLSMEVAGVFRFVIPNFVVGFNVYFILGFFAAGAAALWFFRKVGISRVLSVVLAVLYAIAPYHFIRGENHFWLASYYPVPLAMGLVWAVATGKPIWGVRHSRHRLFGALTGRTAATLVIVFLIGSINSYYALFALFFLVVAAIASLIQSHSWRKFWSAALAGAALILVLFLNLLPDLIYTAIHGPNPEAVVRFPYESEIYSFKLTQLLLPMPGHRIPFLSELRQAYDSGYPYPSESPALGFIAAIGFVSLIVAIVYFAASHRRSRETTPWLSSKRSALGILAALNLVGFLFGTFGGLATIASFITSDLRGSNRISIFIALFCLAGFGIIVEISGKWLLSKAFFTKSVRGGAMIGVIGLVILLIGFADQTSPRYVPNYAQVATDYNNDGQWVNQIQAQVPKNAMIVQLPYRQFPETPPVNGAIDTDMLKPFLHSSTLRWTAGGIKGRATTEWLGLLQTEPTPDVVAQVAAAGFSGIVIDNLALGKGATALQKKLKALLGSPTVTSVDKRYMFYPLSLESKRLKQQDSSRAIKSLGHRATHPVYARFRPNYLLGFSAVDVLKKYSPKLVLDNPTTKPLKIALSFDLDYRSGPAELTLALPRGGTRHFEVTTKPKRYTIHITVPAGSSEADFTIDGGSFGRPGLGDSGPVQVSDVVARQPVQERALDALGG